MKIKVFVISIIFLLLMIGLSGCEELGEDDFITVTVVCKTFISYDDAGILKPVEGAIVRVEIIKAGGERVSDLVTFNSQGVYENTVTGTFKVYNQQPIECIANVVLGTVSNYTDYTFNSESKIIYWEDIDSMADFGDSISFEQNLAIMGIKN